jgi:hypothetical protein
LNFTPLAQRPLRKTWNNAVYFERRVSAVWRVAVPAGGHAVWGTLTTETSDT